MSKKIFITGGSKGIGFAIAQRFHKEGFQVIICARGKAGLDAAKEQIPDLHCYPCDLSDKAEVKQVAAQIIHAHGAMDVLVNNAGVYMPGLIHTEEDLLFETSMATNLNSAYYITKAFLPGMIKRGRGLVVNMCSIASIEPYAHASGSSYSISKYALLGFSKNLREEMKDKGVRVTAIMPGPVWTTSWEGSRVEPESMKAEDIAELTWSAYNMSDRTVVEDIVCRPQNFG